MHAGDFLICKIDGEDDYRVACMLETGDPSKWLAPDGQDVSFTRQDLVDLGRVIAMMLVPEPPSTQEGG